VVCGRTVVAVAPGIMPGVVPIIVADDIGMPEVVVAVLERMGVVLKLAIV
jgi:hypothetical protein